MTTDLFSSTQNIPQEALDHKKLSKVVSGYREIEQFEKSDAHTSYFCYNCMYFLKPNHCSIVTDEGQDIRGNVSGEIKPYAVCALWTPNEAEVK